MLRIDCFGFSYDGCTATSYSRCDGCRFYKPRAKEDEERRLHNGTEDLESVLANYASGYDSSRAELRKLTAHQEACIRRLNARIHKEIPRLRHELEQEQGRVKELEIQRMRLRRQNADLLERLNVALKHREEIKHD